LPKNRIAISKNKICAGWGLVRKAKICAVPNLVGKFIGWSCPKRSNFMRNHQTVLPSNEDCVLTLSQFASNTGISLVTLRRLIARGEGPAVTKLSARRLGIRVRHAREWLDARAFGNPVGA
jgi:predicted DNA-binding transcriptional regulator AlpA